MSRAPEIRAARARLLAAGAALRDRPRARTLDSLATLLDAWCDPRGPWQASLAGELPAATGLSRENVREGLALALRDWTGAALREIAARELEPASRGFASTSVSLAGSIPMPTLSSLLAPLVLHSPVLAKPASRDPVTPRLFGRSLREIDPELAAAVEVVPFDRRDAEAAAAFFDAPCVVATGSDETVDAVSRLVPAGSRLLPHGHRMSVAFAEPRHADALALDVALWDQLGCLSPVAVYCGAADAEPLAAALADALARIGERLPRGEVPTAALAAARRERDEAEMRRAAGADVAVRGDEELRFTVVREADARFRPAPLHRFVRVHPVAGAAGLLDALRPLASHLAAIATDLPAAALAPLGAVRVCPPGSLQTPPLAWHHDGRPLLAPLAAERAAPGPGPT